MNLLAQVRPGSSVKHLASQPFNLIKQEGHSEGLRGAVGSKLAKNMWEMDHLAGRNQAVLCENRVIASLKH